MVKVIDSLHMRHCAADMMTRVTVAQHIISGRSVDHLSDLSGDRLGGAIDNGIMMY